VEARAVAVVDFILDLGCILPLANLLIRAIISVNAINIAIELRHVLKERQSVQLVANCDLTKNKGSENDPLVLATAVITSLLQYSFVLFLKS